MDLVAASSLVAIFFLVTLARSVEGCDCDCAELLGTIQLDFNPAFLNLEEFDDSAGLALYVSSFYNVAFREKPFPLNFFFDPDAVPFERDLVARLPEIDQVIQEKAFETADVEELTDLDPPTFFFWSFPKTDWPNDVIKVPGGVFPFQALLIAQGFLVDAQPGRLSVLNMDDPDRKEYIIDHSSIFSPRYYHQVIFHDFNKDGILDIFAARAPFHPKLLSFIPHGELVYFENPGHDAILQGHRWEERVLYGFPNFGPDIAIKPYDFDGDNVPEFVATSIFGDRRILLLGAPCDGGACSWASVDKLLNPPRVAEISTDQGFPFGVEIVDLNGDLKVEVLATNHQSGLDCNEDEVIDGRVFALEQPESGNIFDDAWTTHILLDQIRPNLTPPGALGCRLAPGAASAIYPNGIDELPWIVVYGDEASKVWVLRPTSTEWVYDNTIVFDINVFYGEDTTQTVLTDPAGITISSIGKGASLQEGTSGAVQVFVPVFEAKEIHVLNIWPCE